MQHYENQRNLQSEITANIENLQNYYGLNSVDSLKRLVEIIRDPKKSEQLFKQRNVTVSSIFEKNNQMQLDPNHISIFASKYSFQKLVQKFPKPRGQTNRVLSAILQKKFAKEVICSHHTRQNLWMLLSGAKFNMLQHRGLYQQLLSYPGYPEYFTRAITQDITRTVKKSQTSEGELKSLENVLTAFSRRNPYVGYCQGLNFVAYFLLTMGFTQEQAFWLLSSIIETVIPMDYYTNMIGVVCDQQLFLTILSQQIPEIVAKFNEVGLDPSVLSIQWFVCLFTSSLPHYLVKIVWDRLLVEGPRAFIKTGIIIMDRFKQEILSVSQFHEIILLLQKSTKQLEMTESQFNSRFQRIFISREGLTIARTLYRQYHIKEKLSEKLNTKKLKEQEIQCNQNWPICAVVLQKNRRTRQQIDVWTFRQNKTPKLDHQYLLRENKKPLKLRPIFQKDFKKTPIKNNPVTSQSKQFQKEEGSYDKQNTIRESALFDNTSVRFSTFDRNDSHKVNATQIEDENQSCKTLIIGRMQHICGKKSDDRPKFVPKEQRKSIIMVQSDQEDNEQLKRSNIIKLIEGEQKDKEDALYRSQTVHFFSKFVSENFELSNIIVPIMKKQ